ncbi:MAG: hypothetical protein M5R41_04700 [Bacteroidia bacterium]|nr:hypothetical protein [Bacteroidia bacterium]
MHDNIADRKQSRAPSPLNGRTTTQVPNPFRPVHGVAPAIVLCAIAALLVGCASPTDPDTPRRRIAEPSKYFLNTLHISEYDEGFDVSELPDGGFIFAGRTWMAHTASIDVLLVRTDAEGIVLWKKTFGGVYEDQAYSVEHTSDGGFIIVGTTESYTNGFTDIWLIKTDAQGTMLWNRSYGGTSYDYGLDVRECFNGGYIVAGQSQQSLTGGKYAMLLRTDELGNEIWNKLYGGRDGDIAASVDQLADGGFVVAGATTSATTGSSALWVFRTSPSGEILWDRSISGAQSNIGTRLHTLADGSVAVIGYSMPPNSQNSNMLFVRLDPAGDVTVNTILHDNAFGTGIDEAADGNFVVCGYTNPYSGDASDIVLSKVSRDGNVLWTRLIGGNRRDRAAAVVITSDNGYLLTGSTRSYGHGDLDLLMLKTNDIGLYEE